MTVKPKTRFHVMTKPTGSLCNLNCKYCYYLEKEKLYPQKMKVIADDVLERYIQSYIDGQHDDDILFIWQGGEPSLCGIDFYQKVVDLQNKYANGKCIQNSFQTNGTFIDEDWVKFFKENDWVVGLSVDGPKELHDAYRKDKAGNGTFDRVMHGLSLLKKHGVPFNTLTTLNSLNVHQPLEVYRFLKDLGGNLIQFLPVIEREATTQDSGLKLVHQNYDGAAKMTNESITPLDFGQFLISVFDEWVRHDVGKVFVQHFETALEAWSGKHPRLCVFSPICGAELVMEHNGDVYSCDHFVYPEYKLGNIMKDDFLDLLHGEQQIKFATAKLREIPFKCQNCKYLGVCNGDCPKHRFAQTDLEEPISYLCEGLFNYFKHIEPYMEQFGQALFYGKPLKCIKSL